MPKIIPRNKQILVQPDAEESRTTDSGLVIPDEVEREKKSIGTVVEVSKEIKDVKKGDRVIFGVYAGERISFKESGKEVDYVLLQDEDVLAFIR